jgi:mannan polymerase II complex ANP1 subunit
VESPFSQNHEFIAVALYSLPSLMNVTQKQRYHLLSFTSHVQAFGKWSRKMGFEVVGLPHYVVWHVYEPSADDLQRIAEMEREKEVREQDVENVQIARARWEKDRKVIEAALEEHRKFGQPELVAQGGAEGPVAHVGEDELNDRANGLTEIDGGNGANQDSGLEQKLH